MADFNTPLPQASAVSDAPSIAASLKSMLTREFWVGIADSFRDGRAARLKGLLRSSVNPLDFSRPGQAEVLQRISANTRVFWPVYAAVVMVPTLVWTLLSSPWLFVGTGVMGAIWTYGYVLKKEAPMLNICGVPIPKLVACGSASLLIMLVTGMISAFLSAAAFGTLLALPHTILHNVPAPELTNDDEMAALQPV